MDLPRRCLLTGLLALAWHHATQRIYVAVERLDDVYLPPGTCCDALTLFSVDGDHWGGQFGFMGDEFTEEESRRLTYVQAQSHTAVPENPSGGRLLMGPPYLAWTTRPPSGKAVSSRDGSSASSSSLKTGTGPTSVRGRAPWQCPPSSCRSTRATSPSATASSPRTSSMAS